MKEFGRLNSLVTLDDFVARAEAQASPDVFLSKYAEPAGLDEVQKAPALFDAIKLSVDRKRHPGRFVLSGSTRFSNRAGIREGLTGRIGLLQLHPMTLAELEALPPKQVPGVRFTPSQVIARAITGGMPVPAFTRDAAQRRLYWDSWLDTTLNRDLSALFKSSYDADFAFNLLNRIGELCRNGELPTLKHFPAAARKVRAYLGAMEEIFLVKRISCHDLGVGKEVWLLMDSGLAAHLMGDLAGEGASMSMLRHLLANEWSALSEYSGYKAAATYFKSAHGAPVDLVRDGIPYKIVASQTGVLSQRAWEERALLGAMKKLGSERGFLVAPVEQPEIPPRGIGVLPWSWWS